MVANVHLVKLNIATITKHNDVSKTDVVVDGYYLTDCVNTADTTLTNQGLPPAYHALNETPKGGVYTPQNSIHGAMILSFNASNAANLISTASGTPPNLG